MTVPQLVAVALIVGAIGFVAGYGFADRSRGELAAAAPSATATPVPRLTSTPTPAPSPAPASTRPPRVPGSGDFVRRFDPLAAIADVPDGSRCAGHFMAQFAPGDPAVFVKGWAALCRLAPESQDDFVKRLSEEIAKSSPGNGYTLDSDEHGGNIAVVPYDEGDLRGTVTIVSSPVSNGLELTLILQERSAQP